MYYLFAYVVRSNEIQTFSLYYNVLITSPVAYCSTRILLESIIIVIDYLVKVIQ